MAHVPCPDCEDDLICSHTNAERELLWRQHEDGSVELAIRELVTLLREARCDVSYNDTGNCPVGQTPLVQRIDAALARWQHLPDLE